MQRMRRLVNAFTGTDAAERREWVATQKGGRSTNSPPAFSKSMGVVTGNSRSQGGSLSVYPISSMQAIKSHKSSASCE